MSKDISIGSWAYTIGPYTKSPVDFETVCDKLEELGFNGVELGSFKPHPNPDDLPEKSQREELMDRMRERGLAFSGIAANLWGEKLINTDDQSKYICRVSARTPTSHVISGLRAFASIAYSRRPIHREVDYHTALESCGENLEDMRDIAADNGQYVTWEFEPGFAFNKPSDILRIHDAVDKRNFGLVYDTCHGQMVGVVGARQEGEKETFRNSGGIHPQALRPDQSYPPH